MNRPKIAIIGARGLGKYGGFETFVGELVSRLENRSYDIYCSHEEKETGENSLDNQKSTALYFPLRFPRNYTLRKVFENLYDWYFVIKCTMSPRCDVIYCLGALSGLLLVVPRILGITTMINMDGLEWRRGKLSSLERTILRFYFVVSCWLSNYIVVDNRQLVEHIPHRFRKKAVFLPYGVSSTTCPMWERGLVSECTEGLDFHVNPRDYWIVVARLEPENNIHTIVEGYIMSKSARPLVVVGDFTSSKYKNTLDDLLMTVPGNKRLLMIGPIYRKDVLVMLRCHCLAYIHGHSVGGTNPSLLEAMAVGNLIIAHDNLFNREVSGDTVLFFREPKDLAAHLDRIENDTEDFSEFRKRTQKRAFENYEWTVVASLYNGMFLKALG